MPTRKVIVLAESQNTGLVPGSKINVSEVGLALGELGRKLAFGADSNDGSGCSSK